MIAVLACPALLCVDLVSPSNILFGCLYLLLLLMVSNERRTLIALFTTVATVSLLFDLRFIYAQPGAELAVMDKIVALAVLPLLTTALIRKRTLQLKARKRKPVCTITVVPPLTERIALHSETNPVFRHMRRSNEPMDEYTRELIWFVYSKSPKN